MSVALISGLCEALMRYEVIPLLVVLAIPLLAGVALVVDAVRRAIREGRATNHDLHV